MSSVVLWYAVCCVQVKLIDDPKKCGDRPIQRYELYVNFGSTEHTFQNFWAGSGQQNDHLANNYHISIP